MSDTAADRAAVLQNEAETLLRAALDTESHRLIKYTDASVACSCGEHEGPDRGEDAGEAWRGHLIDAAIAAFRQWWHS